MRILIAVDGSKHALDAVQFLIEHAGWLRAEPQVELVTVHAPVPKLPGLGTVVGKKQLQRYYEDEGEEALAGAKKLLDKAKIGFNASVLIGPVAETIVAHAGSAHCDLVVIGNRGMSAAANMLLGSIATKVLHLSPIPVLLVK